LAYDVVRLDAKINLITQTRVRAELKRPKRTRNRLRGHDFTPFSAAPTSTTKAACDYTKWPEVTALSRLAVKSERAIWAVVTDPLTERRAAKGAAAVATTGSRTEAGKLIASGFFRAQG
jgi:hypothetical protein